MKFKNCEVGRRVELKRDCVCNDVQYYKGMVGTIDNVFSELEFACDTVKVLFDDGSKGYFFPKDLRRFR